MLLALSLFGIRTSMASTAASTGSLIDPNGFINATETTSTSWGAGLASDSTGLKGTAQDFRAIYAGAPSTISGVVHLRVPWTLTTQSAGAGTRGTVSASLIIDGVEIVVSTGSVARSLNSANGTEFVELIELIMPLGTSVAVQPGSAIVIRLQPKVTTASGVGGSTWEPTLRHDPQSIASQLVAEFTGFGGSR